LLLARIQQGQQVLRFYSATRAAPAPPARASEDLLLHQTQQLQAAGS
jgi:hypothetical protein